MSPIGYCGLRLHPLPPPAGGRGQGEGADVPGCGAIHLTLPRLPLPPKRRRGAFRPIFIGNSVPYIIRSKPSRELTAESESPAADPVSLRDARRGAGAGFSATAGGDGFSATEGGVGFSATGFGGEA
jgi:hypothetical protein